MSANIPVSILVMFLTIYGVRVLPLTLLKKEIKNPFIRSFLYYVPYVSLSVMTFPAILSATADVRSGLAGFAAAVILAWWMAICFEYLLEPVLQFIWQSYFCKIPKRR